MLARPAPDLGRNMPYGRVSQVDGRLRGVLGYCPHRALPDQCVLLLADQLRQSRDCQPARRLFDGQFRQLLGGAAALG